MGSSANGADDGIRTRDPHLGKAMGTVQPVGPFPLSCASSVLTSVEFV